MGAFGTTESLILTIARHVYESYATPHSRVYKVVLLPRSVKYFLHTIIHAIYACSLQTPHSNRYGSVLFAGHQVIVPQSVCDVITDRKLPIIFGFVERISRTGHKWLCSTHVLQVPLDPLPRIKRTRSSRAPLA